MAVSNNKWITPSSVSCCIHSSFKLVLIGPSFMKDNQFTLSKYKEQKEEIS